MLRLYPTQDFVTPYDYDTEGFTERWWHSSLTAEPLEDQKKNDYWSFREGVDEIARAWVDRGTLDDLYVELDPPDVITDIVFFEVKKQCRRQGHGTAAARLLTSHYEGQLITAFPIDAAADSFWHSAGFTYRPRRDGADRRGAKNQEYDPLLIFDKR